MSTAQALTAGLLASPAPVRGSDARPAADGGAFRDTLDKAARSREPAASEAPADASDASPRGTDPEAATEAEGRGGEAASARGEPAAADFTLLLAALNGQAGAAEASAEAGALDRDAAAALPANLMPGEAGEAALAMPGEVDGGETAADVGGSIEIEAGVQRLGEAATVKATVVGQETHLALEPVRAEALARLAGQDAASTEAAQAGVEQPPGGAAADVMEGIADRRAATQVPESRSQASGSGPARGWQDGGGFEPAVAGGGSGAQGGGAQQGNAQNGQGQGPGNSAVFAALAGVGARAAADVDAGEDFSSFMAPGEQIAAEVRAELTAGGLGEGSSDGMVKVLHLELKPANLGSVTVRIALKDNAVTLHLETQRRETLAAIEREKDALAAVLSSAGYTVDGISASPQSEASRSGTMFAPAASGGAGDMGQQTAGQGLADSSSGQREGQSASGNAGYRSRSDGNDDGTSGTRRVADGLYV